MQTGNKLLMRKEASTNEGFPAKSVTTRALTPATNRVGVDQGVQLWAASQGSSFSGPVALVSEVSLRSTETLGELCLCGQCPGNGGCAQSRGNAR